MTRLMPGSSEALSQARRQRAPCKNPSLDAINRPYMDIIVDV
jgi:hypothetical protein